MRRVFFQRKVHPVFPRHTLKGLDIFAGDLDVLNTCALAYKLLYGLLAVVDFGVLGLRQIFPNGPFQQAGGQPAAGFADLDGESHGFIAYFIRSCAALALADETKVMEELRKSCQCDSEEESRRIKEKLSESERRLSELDVLISKLYEDWVAGRINETNFTRMMEKAQGEQEVLQKKVDTMRERLNGVAREQEDNSKWLSLIRQHADIKELDREMLHLLIKEIVVHEDMAEGKRSTTVEIHFNFMKQGSQLTVKS